MSLPDHAARTAALTDFQHNLVVVAGAGTGKTSLLVGRLASALVRLHMSEHEVLALTFTDNAATEMRERLVRLLRAVEPWLEGEPVEHVSDLHTLEELGFGPEDLPRVRTVLEASDRLPISTFHGFCARLLQRHARRLGLPPEQRVGDPEASYGRYSEAFLDYLREQNPDEVHPALVRFDPKDLRELGWALLTLPPESITRCVNTEPPAELEQIRAGLLRLNEQWPKALSGFRRQVEVAAAAATALLEQGTMPELDELVRAARKPGRGVPAEERESVVAELAGFLDAIRPHALADDAGIGTAIEFMSPFLEHFRADCDARGELTFDDVILQTRSHLMRDAKLREDAGASLRAILVDEFQDTDPLQYDIVFLLGAQPIGGSVTQPLKLPLRDAVLFIVGDPKQSIYRFRRADIAAFDRAMQNVLECRGKRCDLVANFRSAAPVLELVNHVGARQLAEDRPYQLGYEPVQTVLDEPDSSVRFLTVQDTEDVTSDERRKLEGELVVRLIEDLRLQGRRYGDIAILLRAATDTTWLLRPLRSLGIPYALEGSRRFYQRHEVVVACALLTAVARPHDPIGVLGVLRSALSTATDREIHDFVAKHGAAALDFRVPGKAKQSPVGRTLEWLRALRAEVCELPVDCALERLFRLDAWTITEGSGYEGAQRLANIDRLLRTLKRHGAADLAGALEFVERRTVAETEDEESPLFDRDFDAVRVMTIHASKGLEFDTVIVPDLARMQVTGDRPNGAQVDRVIGTDGEDLIGVRFGPCRNVASYRIEQQEKRHAIAEERRLFYVAATRAKRDLVLIGAEKAAGRNWQRELTECAPFPGSTSVETIEVKPLERKTPKHENDLAASTLAAWRTHEELIGRSEPKPAPAPEPPSLFSPRVSPQAPADVEIERAAATELGTAVHRYLALLDRSGERVPTLVEQLDRSAFGDDFRLLVDRIHASEMLTRLRNADQVLRELPVTYAGNAPGETIHGVIDLLIQEAGRWTVIDHKTDRVLDTQHAEAAEQHREQLTRYADGVRRALALDADPARAIWFIRDDVVVDLG